MRERERQAKPRGSIHEESVAKGSHQSIAPCATLVEKSGFGVRFGDNVSQNQKSAFVVHQDNVWFCSTANQQQRAALHTHEQKIGGMWTAIRVCSVA